MIFKADIPKALKKYYGLPSGADSVADVDSTGEAVAGDVEVSVGTVTVDRVLSVVGAAVSCVGSTDFSISFVKGVAGATLDINDRSF